MFMKKQEQNKRIDYEFYAQIAVIVVLVITLFYSWDNPTGNTTVVGLVSASEIIPTGIPEVYGEELGISYDYVSPNNPKLADDTIRFLGNIDVVETLEGEDMERYIDILYNQYNGISCEYCCGARAIIFENGDMACGCAHSYAMRGLTKYLIKYHTEMSDEQILTEVGKWKVLFFPGILEGKASVMKSYGIETSYINLTTNTYRGIEQGKASGGSSQVGSC